jgi:NAD(P)-dependent dehydrogenase (short-subunit alcohol dehydrogenase family)
MDLRGKTAFVTGGAIRIGRAICEKMAERGADVVIHYNRSATEAEQLKKELEQRGVRAATVQGLLESEEACAQLMKQAREALGDIDILINNASVFNKHTLEQADMAAWMGEMWVNFFAPVQLMRAFAAQTPSGKVVNLLDRRVTTLDPACVPYWISKKALADLTRVAALHYAPRISVNGVAPGAVLPPPGEGANYIKEYAGHVPMEVQVTPEDIAAAVLFVLEQDTITGQIIYVDGGQHL